MENFYEILGVEETASQDDIKKAYRDLSKKYHPDVNSGDKNSEEKFKKINEAYSVLGDKTKRKEYDHKRQFGGNNFDPFSGFGHGGMPPEFFDMFFGNRQGGGFRRNVQKKGGDLKIHLEFELSDVLTTTTKRIHYKKHTRCKSCDGNGSLNGNSTARCTVCNGFGSVNHISQTPFGRIEQTGICHNCSGSGSVIVNVCNTCGGNGILEQGNEIEITIPPGIHDGYVYKIDGGGNEPKEKNGISGGLFIVCYIKPHAIYKHIEKDLHRDIFISLIDAIDGNVNFKIELLDKTSISITIPPNSENGKVLRLKNLGLPFPESNVRGNLYLYVNVYVPKNLPEDIIKKLKKLESFLTPEEKELNYEDGILNKAMNIKHLYG